LKLPLRCLSRECFTPAANTRTRRSVYNLAMKTKLLLTLCLLLAAAPGLLGAGSSVSPPPNVATFSIVGIDPANGDLGVAVASRYFSVGSVVPWAMAGVGAVATQANVNVGYGQQAIDLLRQGLTAQQVLARLLAEDTFPGKEGRQVAIVDAKGNVAVHTGPDATPWAGDRKGATWSAQGNRSSARPRRSSPTSGSSSRRLSRGARSSRD
jgi:hypothetical protein